MLYDFCEVRTESRFHFVVVMLYDFCEVRTESRFHFVVAMLYDFCEVRTESRFHFVVAMLYDFCEVRTETLPLSSRGYPKAASSAPSYTYFTQQIFQLHLTPSQPPLPTTQQSPQTVILPLLPINYKSPSNPG
jgi:hypothetical protein